MFQRERELRRSDRPLSVCLMAGEFPPAVGGVADYSALLARNLRLAGLEVRVMAGKGRDRKRASHSDQPAASVQWVSGWGPGAVARLARQLRAAPPDVIHLQYQAAAFAKSPLVNVLPAVLRTLGIRCPFVTTFHDLRVPYLFPKAGPLRPLAIRALLRLSDGVVFTDAADSVSSEPRGQATWVPIGPNVAPTGRVSRADARARWGLREREVVLAYFGFVNASKGVFDLLDATGRLVEAGVPVRLFFVGEELGSTDPTNQPTAAALWADAERRGLSARIVRTGWLDEHELSQALAAADLAVLPYRDGGSLRRGSLLACLAHGLPVVTTTPVPQSARPELGLVPPFDHPELYRLDDRVVALAAPGDGADLARVTYRLLNDPQRREQLGLAGRAFAERLAWPAIADATVSFYHRLLGHGPDRG